ncbi:MAG: glutathione-dependent disulfide-bond oxidoreductase [Motiliproteus sp.]|nr:glutathione-dependent disulfide-bond oxidoreductase [Motiliproteus sp.]
MNDYVTPPVWSWDEENGGSWAKVNRPISGAIHEAVLPQGEQPLQLYSMATPNGQKVTIMLEELLALGESAAEYDAHLIRIGEGDQFSSGFVDLNPNSKIPALVDRSGVDGSGKAPIRVFESGAILLYLADKFGQLLPKEVALRTEALNWLFWLQGSAPYLGGGFGHFYSYAPIKMEYPINRFTMEVKRQFDLLDKQLADKPFIAGDHYSIADIAIWPWYGNLVLGSLYDAADFLDAGSYRNVMRWAEAIAERPSVNRGRIVNRSWGEAWEMLADRHSSQDIDKVLALKPE